MLKKGKFIAVRPDTLIEARYDLTPKQNDILDIVLSKIEESDNKYCYELFIDDYKKIYKKNISNIYRDFKKAVKDFEGKGFYLIDNINKKEIFFVWFASILYEDNIAKITVEVGHTLKKLLLKMKKKIYYKLDYPLNFNSIYSKRIYYYIKSFEDTGWRIDNLDNLRRRLQCPKSYNKYTDFKRFVLSPAYKEINNYSDLTFEYQEIKEKRKVVAIKFLIKSNKKYINDEANIIDVKNVQSIENENKDDIFHEIKIDTEAQVEENIQEENDEVNFIETLFDNTLSKLECAKILAVARGDLEKVKEAYTLAMQQTSIKNLCAWIISCIKNNYNFPVAVTNIDSNSNINSNKIDSFNNFEQREYDFDALEKKLLGWDTPEDTNTNLDPEEMLEKFLEELSLKGLHENTFYYYPVNFTGINGEIQASLNGTLMYFRYKIDGNIVSLICKESNEIIVSKAFFKD